MSPVEAPDALSADALRSACAGQRIGNQIEVFAEVTSTNDIAWQMASERKEGLVVFAESQSSGRGQHGKRWESVARKGLWFSILLRPQIVLADAGRLTLWAAQTVAGTIRDEFSLDATVKRPNDVCIAQRKVAGVLLEMRAMANAPHLGILGVGINVNQALEDFPEELRQSAGSLALASGGQINRQALAVAILRNLDRTYRENFAS